MRKAILLLTPLMLGGLILYMVWEPVPEPTTQSQNTVPVTPDLEDVTSQEPIAEGNREPLRESEGNLRIPGRLTIEEYRKVHEALVKRQANSVRLIANLHEVIEKARSELIRRREFASLQTRYIDEIKFRLAITKLDNGQFEKASRPSSSSSGLIAVRTGGTSLVLTFDAYSISFEYLPGEFPGLFAMMDQREEAQVAILQFQCDEFNRLPFDDRESRIESHLQANTMLRILENNGSMGDTNSRAKNGLRRSVLPRFMVIDRNTYTVRPR